LLLLEVEKFININRWYKYKNNKLKNNVYVLRIKEHSSNIKLISSKHSVITEHILKYSYTFDWKNIKILDSEPNFYKRSISEMI